MNRRTIVVACVAFVVAALGLRLSRREQDAAVGDRAPTISKPEIVRTQAPPDRGSEVRRSLPRFVDGSVEAPPREAYAWTLARTEYAKTSWEPLYQHEARDERWAREMERTLADRIEQTLRAKSPATKLDVSCKSTLCKLTYSTDGDPPPVSGSVDGVPLGVGYQTLRGDSTAKRYEALVLFAPTSREPADYLSWVSRIRTRSQRTP